MREHRTCVVRPSSGREKEVVLFYSDDVAGRHMTVHVCKELLAVQGES